MQLKSHNRTPPCTSSEILDMSVGKHNMMRALLKVFHEPRQDVIQIEGVRIFGLVRLISLHRIHQGLQASFIVLRIAIQFFGEFQSVHEPDADFQSGVPDPCGVLRVLSLPAGTLVSAPPQRHTTASNALPLKFSKI